MKMKTIYKKINNYFFEEGEEMPAIFMLALIIPIISIVVSCILG